MTPTIEPFRTLKSPGAPLPEAAIDTDAIYPARFLIYPTRNGLGRFLFHDRRFTGDGSPRADFVLNRAPFAEARILVCGANFGCGSSREQAVWALRDFGIACVIAPSFGEIFQANCVKSGLLAIALAAAAHAEVLHYASRGEVLTVDLERRRIVLGASEVPFAIDAFQRRCLLEGLDETGLILAEDADAIAAYEAHRRQEASWLFATNDSMTTKRQR
jgi:3-isopropylmalate dehydratase small subunit